MQKVYLLLRNNRKSGPFTIDELWQQQLRPTDMVWIEGQSTAWCYLSELELKPSVSLSAAPEVPIASPRDEIERKAEELRRRALAATAPANPLHVQPLAVRIKRDEEASDEEETIDFIDHRKEKKNVFGEVLMTVLIIAFFAGGIYSGQSFFKNKNSTTSPQVTHISSDDKHEAARIINQQTTQDTVAAQNIMVYDSSAALADTVAVAAAPKPRISPARQQSAKETTSVRQTPVVPIPLDNNSEAAIEPEKKLPDSADTEKPVEAKSPVVTEQPEKKKGFLRGIFKKKKKDEEKTVEEKTGSEPDNQ
jgi:hypothetical protein